jgi:hypothetical protein
VILQTNNITSLQVSGPFVIVGVSVLDCLERILVQGKKKDKGKQTSTTAIIIRKTIVNGAIKPSLPLQASNNTNDE